MTAAKAMAELAARGETYGDDLYVDAGSIAEAEAYVGRYPQDRRGNATSAAVEVAGKDEALALVRAAGYGAPAGGLRPSSCGRFVARITVSRYGTATVWVKPAGGREAWAIGPGGYLPPGDRPEM